MTASIEKTCTNKGCGKKYIEEENSDLSCKFHSKGPIFHEGLKGWGCCSKRVMTFEEFLEIPGCTTGKHSDYVVKEPEPVKQPKMKENEVEVHKAPSFPSVQQSATVKQETKPKEPEPEEEDPENVQISENAACKRNGCGYAYKNDDLSRGQGEEAICNYHPGTPIFHEGSKGWSCCSRKVLEFDEFLKIKGCKQGKHLFVGQPVKKKAECRHDWYQSPSTVTVSIYAKQVDKKTVDIEFKENHLRVAFVMPDGSEFEMQTELFQPIVPAECSFEVLKTKIELVLKKANGISWAALERTDNVTTWTTFGTTGGTGTVGGKEMFLAADAPLMALK